MQGIPCLTAVHLFKTTLDKVTLRENDHLRAKGLKNIPPPEIIS